MPEPVWSNDLMVWSMPEAGAAVKILANQRLCASWGALTAIGRQGAGAI
jgi:hypothetical protein